MLFGHGFRIICVTVLRVRQFGKSESDGSTLTVPCRLLGSDSTQRCRLVVRSLIKVYLNDAAPMP